MHVEDAIGTEQNITL